MVRPMRKTRAPTQSQRAIGHIAALQSIATMFVMHAMVGRSTLQFKMPRLDAYLAAENRQLRGNGKHRGSKQFEAPDNPLHGVQLFLARSTPFAAIKNHDYRSIEKPFREGDNLTGLVRKGKGWCAAGSL